MSIYQTNTKVKIHVIDKELLSKLERYNVSPKNFLKYKNQFETKTADNYIIKMIIDAEARQNGVRGRLEKAVEIYGNLAAFIASEEKDNPIETIKNMHRLTLRHYSRLGYSHVRIKNCGDVGCRACKSLSDKIMDIRDALKEMPLPNSLCSFDLYQNGHSFCRCSYEPISASINIKEKKVKRDHGIGKKYFLPAVILTGILLALMYFIIF